MNEEKTAEELAAEEAAKIEADEAAKLAAEEAEAEAQRKKAEDDDEQDEDDEEDPYEAELKRLENEKKLAEDKSRQKSGALAEERKKRLDAEKRLADAEKGNQSIADEKIKSLKEELKAEIRQDAQIESLTTNPKEQELIRYYIANNNLSVHDAWVLANKKNLTSAYQRSEELDEEERALARLSGASASNTVDKKSPLYKAASDGLTEKERKHLSV